MSEMDQCLAHLLELRRLLVTKLEAFGRKKIAVDGVEVTADWLDGLKREVSALDQAIAAVEKYNTSRP